jgi:hypothetical protein
LLLTLIVALGLGPIGVLGQAALRIVVLEGEDGVNIVDKQTAVQPVVQVVDQNSLPVAGASVVFRIAGRGAQFAGRAQQLTLTTDAAGRAAVTGLSPTGSGALQIQVRATFQRQLVTTTIHQTNFATQAAAQTAAAAAGATGGAAATGATAGAASASVGGGLSALAIGGIAAAAGGGTLVAVKAAKSGSNDDSGSGNNSNVSQNPGPSNEVWSVFFSPQINVTMCLPAGAPNTTFGSQVVNVDPSTTALHGTWQSLLQVDGTLTTSTLTATLTCIGGGSGTGVLTATKNGSAYDGNATLGAQTVGIHVILGCPGC